jgi:hypothetical protein
LAKEYRRKSCLMKLTSKLKFRFKVKIFSFSELDSCYLRSIATAVFCLHFVRTKLANIFTI